MAATKNSLLLVSVLVLVLGVLTPTLSASGKGGGAEPPAPPEDLSLVGATRTELKLEWSRSKNEKVEEYEIYTSELRDDVLVDSLRGKTKRPTYTLGELECGTSYRLAVAAVDRGGDRSELTRATMATKECVLDATPPQPTPSSPAPSGDGKPETTSGSSAPAPTQPSPGPTGQPSQQTDTAAQTEKVAQADKTPGDTGSGTTSETSRGTVDGTAPTKPLNLRVVSTTSSQVGLAWDRSRDNGKVVGYDVYLDDAMKGITSRPGYTLGDLACSTTHAVSVMAKDKAGNRSAPALTTVATSACADVTPPSAPTNFRSEFTTTASAILVWDASSDNVGVTSYGIYDAGIRILETPEPKQALTGLACGTTYYYLVDAADGAGNRSLKVPATITTLACTDGQAPTKPAPVTVLDATPSAVTVSWPTATDNVGVDHYNVYRGAAAVAETTSTSTTVTGLSCGTAYSIGVNAEDGAGNASDMASTVAQTDACAGSGDGQPPSAPGAPAATSASQTSIGVTWAPATDNVGVTGYTVYRDGAAAGTSTATSYTVSGLSCGVTYRVAVDAFDAAGNRSAPTEAFLSTAACADTTRPLAPASVTMASQTQTSISITWPAATDNVGVVGYGVYKAGAKVTDVAERAYTFAGLTCGMNYTLGVDAYDAAGNRSLAATTVIIATTACADTTAPTAPTNLASSSITQTGLTLSWSPSTDNVGVTGYEVSQNGTKVASPTTTSTSQTALTCGTSYSFSVLALDAAGNKSAPSSLTVSTATCATGPTPTLRQVDGGTGYYSGYSNPLPASSIPIGVWFESVISQSDVSLDKDVGINTYVVLTRNSDLGLVGSNGMKAMVQRSEWLGASLGSETSAWELHDEIDMQMSPSAGCAELKSLRDSLPADGRIRYNNFGKGVMFWESDAEAACYVNAVSLPSNDIYWFTDPNVCGISEGGDMFTGGARALTESECRRASNYGAVVQRMRNLVSGSKPIWNFVEVGHPFSEDWAPTITAPQIRAAVWHSFIAGARGIIYFNHNFGGPCHSQHVLRDGCGSAVRPTVRAVNAQVQSLAGQLNSPTLTSGFTASASVKAMAKWDGQNFYVFAGSSENTSSTGSFSIPCLGNATATVVGEARTVPINAGTFTDSFADGLAVHIYRIDGGSRCGL